MCVRLLGPSELKRLSQTALAEGPTAAAAEPAAGRGVIFALLDRTDTLRTAPLVAHEHVTSTSVWLSVAVEAEALAMDAFARAHVPPVAELLRNHARLDLPFWLARLGISAVEMVDGRHFSFGDYLVGFTRDCRAGSAPTA